MSREKYQLQDENSLVFRSGDVILDEVGQAHIMYAVESGKIHIEYDWDVIDVVSTGEFIGDIFQTATLVAVSDCVLIPLDRV